MFACEIYGGQRADWQIHFKLWMAGCLLVRLVVYQASHIFGSSKDSTLNSWIASSTCFEILSSRILYFAEWKQTRDIIFAQQIILRKTYVSVQLPRHIMN